MRIHQTTTHQQLLASIALVLFTVTARAGAPAGPVPLPPTDLGETNILDGVGGPGALLEMTTTGYSANRLTDSQGSSLPGSNEQQIETVVLHPILVAPTSWGGAYPGVDVLIPFAAVRNDFGGAPAASAHGLGDIAIASSLQWSGIGAEENVFVRLALKVVVPSGKYSYDQPVNAGQGDWQLSPYVAMTWRMSPRWEFSGRMIYGWSSAASAVAANGVTGRWQPGDFVVLDTCASYALTPTTRLGIASYALRQLRSSKEDGISEWDSLQRVAAAGPVARWHMGQSTITLAGYKEFAAANRPEGFAANLRWLHPF